MDTMRNGARVFCPWAASALLLGAVGVASAQPSMTDPAMRVSTVVSGLAQPTGMAFIGANEFLVLERATGRVKRVVNGGVTATVLDLAVNSVADRGLLGIALDPDFPTAPNVYLFWTQSQSGVDSTIATDVALLANRVDRFVWNGSTLAFAASIATLRALQTDQNDSQAPSTVTPQGTNNGGKLAIGPDRKLYVALGDVGRRGWLQNLSGGPLTPPGIDDTFGGPAPDNAHLTGAILRLNLDGSTPVDNPFYAAGAAIGGAVGANIQKLFSYGHRTGFGLAFDAVSGRLWTSEQGDDAFDEINKVVPGGDYGWIQAMGPLGRLDQFKTIEANLYAAPAVTGSLQQLRYPVSRVAATVTAAQNALFTLPGSIAQDPELSWRYAIAPSGLGFVRGPVLGSAFTGTLWSGMARATDITGGATGTYAGGALMAFRLTSDRQHLDLGADARLADRVADNGAVYPPPPGTAPATAGFKFDGRESESLLIGQGFGAVTDIQAGPDQALYVTSSSAGAIYRVVRAPVPPTLTPQVAGTKNGSGVYESAVSVSWVIGDGGFDIVSSTGCAATTLTADTPGTTITCSATNALGLNATVSVTVAIDQHFVDVAPVPGTLGAIPDAPAVGVPGAPRDVRFSVANMPRVGLVAVSLTLNPVHTAVGDLTATLIAPDGTSHVLFARPGTTNDLAGPYVFRDTAVLDFRGAAASGTPVAAGTYRTSTAAGLTVMNAVLGGRNGNGVWTLRFVDQAPGNVGSVSAATLSLAPSLPSNLRVNAVVGNAVQLRWDAPAGASPIQYIVEGGVTPGVPLAVLATGLAAPIFDFVAPSGTFWVRVRADENGVPSLPTAEVPLVVGVAAMPSPPADFTATVAGSGLNVSWRNTFAGGAPTDVVLDVSGSATGTLAIGSSGAVDFGAVPAGTYALSLRAVNAGGVSASSNALTVTVPFACSGGPNPPTRFLFYRQGGVVSMLWDPPASGPAPAGYDIEVTGSVNGTVPLGGRVLTVPAPPGSYTVRVRATNACGASAFTAAQTVVVP